MPDLLTDALPPVSLKDQLACAQRELALRQRVYPRWVEAGKLKQSIAEEEIRRMAAICETLEDLLSVD